MKKLGELFGFIHAKRIVGLLPEDREPKKVTQDTREVETGDVFICIKGSNFDGHELAGDAVANGAQVVVAERPLPAIEAQGIPVVYVKDTHKIMAILAKAFYGDPAQEMRLVGVTGTNGKTTVTHMIEAICRHFQTKTGVVGTLGIRIEDTKIASANTTPDSITLQRSLRSMVDSGVSVGTLEVSSHALDQGRVWGIDFDVAVLTNITHEHLDYHHTMEAYSRTKELLFSQLGTGWKNTQMKYAVLNKDDPAYQAFRTATSAQVLSYSLLDSSADLFAQNIRITAEGTRFEVVANGGIYPVSLSMIGEYNVANALAAIAAAWALGYSLEGSCEALSELSSIDGRLERMEGTGDYQVIVDYAHTPDGLEKVLHAIRQVTPGRIILVMGCRGERDTEKRPEMGKIATEQSEWTVFTTDSPGREAQPDILRMLLSQVKKQNYEYIEQRADAIRHAVWLAEPGDTVLITGRGHEATFRIGDQDFPLVDGDVARLAITDREKASPAGAVEAT